MMENEFFSTPKAACFDSTDNSSKKFLQKNTLRTIFFPEDIKPRIKKKRVLSDVNNGRWNSHEHQLFLEAILQFGNEWKKVQQHIKSRSSTQARSHAQKFFINIKSKLSPHELAKLKKDSVNSEHAIPAEKISKMFKDPNSNFESIDKERLIMFFMNLGNLSQRKVKPRRKVKLEASQNAELNFAPRENFQEISFGLNFLECVSQEKKKIFKIEKKRLKKFECDCSQLEINFSEISYKKRESSTTDLLKLKRDLKTKKNQKQSLKWEKIDKPEPLINENLRLDWGLDGDPFQVNYETKDNFEEINRYFNTAPRNALDIPLICDWKPTTGRDFTAEFDIGLRGEREAGPDFSLEYVNCFDFNVHKDNALQECDQNKIFK
jgi:SHAQKYF class myb-like DNA-binding protein